MFDKRMEEAKLHFGIVEPTDWQGISPDEIRTLENFGPGFVDYLRLVLANMGLTLLNDETPHYWQTHLKANRGTSVSETDTAIVSDFTILIDTGEQQPFHFQGTRTDAGDPWIIRTKRKALGHSMGDYSVEGLEGWVHVERKSCQDAISTVAGYGQHQDNFIKTLEQLAGMPYAAVVVECDRDEMLNSIVPRGTKTKAQIARSINRQIMAWELDYRVPWIFSASRRHAENRCLYVLRRAYKHHIKSIKESKKA